MRTDVGLGGVGSHRKIQDPAKWKEEATREGREWSLGPLGRGGSDRPNADLLLEHPQLSARERGSRAGQHAPRWRDP